MSNTPHRSSSEEKERSSPMLFVIVLLVAIAGVLAFVAFHSNEPHTNASPATQASPASTRTR